MKYQNELKRQKYRRLRRDLCKIYKNVDSWEEFCITANLTYGKIPLKLLIAFKLYYFRKIHPLIYFSCRCFLHTLLVCCWFFVFFPLIILHPFLELTFVYSIGDTIKYIERNE